MAELRRGARLRRLNLKLCPEILFMRNSDRGKENRRLPKRLESLRKLFCAVLPLLGIVETSYLERKFAHVSTNL